MLDLRFVLENVELVRKNARARNAIVDIDLVVMLHGVLKDARHELDETNHESNLLADRFKGADDATRRTLRHESATLRERAARLREAVALHERAFMEEFTKIPNLCAPDVPDGLDERGNVAVKHVGAPTRFAFKPRDHVELGTLLDIIDFPAGTKTTGPKFYFLKNEGVLLELALVRLATDLALRHGFTPLTTPELAKDEIIAASGFVPRGPESQIYSLAEGGLSLIGTSEITIGGYLADSVLRADQLPIKVCGISHCFRTEAGSGGRESRGLYRVHQFGKVELYQFTLPEASAAAHEEMLAIEEEFYGSLELPYRVLNMCKGDLGAPAYKKYDIEAWMPFIGDGGGYGEVTSTSNCTDFQSRRLNVKFKDASGKKSLVHTLNGTAVATTRTMVAILENFQNEDGSVTVPKVLRPYVGTDVILPKERRF